MISSATLPAARGGVVQAGWTRSGSMPPYLGPLGLPKRVTFKRASAAPSLSPVWSDGHRTPATTSPSDSPLFKPDRTPEKEKQTLPSTPEGRGTYNVEKAPLQVSVMTRQDRMRRGEPQQAKAEDALLSALASLEGVKKNFPQVGHSCLNCFLWTAMM